MPNLFPQQWEHYETALEELPNRLLALRQEAVALHRGEHIKRNGSPS